MAMNTSFVGVIRPFLDLFLIARIIVFIRLLDISQYSPRPIKHLNDLPGLMRSPEAVAQKSFRIKSVKLFEILWEMAFWRIIT